MKYSFAKALLFSLVAVSLSQCKKEDDLGTEPPTNSSISSLMSGSYTGNGEYLPQGINLGTHVGCVSVPYQSYIQTGAATLLVTPVSDYVATFQFMSGAFPTITLNNVALTRSGNIITFNGGSFNIATGNFSYSGRTPNSFWVITDACLIQAPYVYGVSIIFSNNNYAYLTIDHLYYSGVKN